MPTVSRAYVEQFAERNALLTDSMRGALERVLAGVDISNRDLIVMRVNTILKPYTDMSAAMAAEFYNGIREAAVLTTEYAATAINEYDEEQVRIDTLSVVNEVDEGGNTVPFAKVMGDMAARHMKDASENSIRANARRDPAKPKYAIVPNGQACAFCVMRAGLGYHYPEAKSVKSHQGCTCVPTPVFGDTKVQGYDPAKYESQYYKAAEALDSGELPDELREKLQRNKDAKGKEFDRTKQILMVMREQQSIS